MHDRYVRAGIYFLLLALVVIGVVATPFILSNVYDLRGQELLGKTFPVAFVGFALMSWLLTRIGRLTSDTAEQVMARDPRPPVLYLRSFAADDRDDRTRRIQYLTRNRSGPEDSIEEQLVRTLDKEVGPVIAIGRPGERLPPLGAARMYVQDSEWRDKVRELLQVCALVVLRAGSSPGLEWELQTSIEEVPPGKVLLLLPTRRAYRSFREWANTIIPKPLPPEWPGEAVKFLADWTPVASPTLDSRPGR
jgi:hypothetical protein